MIEELEHSFPFTTPNGIGELVAVLCVILGNVFGTHEAEPSPDQIAVDVEHGLLLMRRSTAREHVAECRLDLGVVHQGCDQPVQRDLCS